MTKRLFTFGCSFTQWNWPTWADIVGQNYEHYENWGLAGIGNRAIAERINECDLKNNFDKDTVVLIQWTDYHRFDHHMKDFETHASWRFGGNIFDKDIETPFVLDTWREASYIYNTLNYINLVYHLLKTKGCQFYMFPRIDMKKDLDRFSDLSFQRTVFDYPEWIYDPIQDFADSLGYTGKPMHIRDTGKFFKIYSNELITDLHPLPKHYAQWVEKTLVDNLGISVDWDRVNHFETVISKVNHYDQLNNDYENDMGWRIKGNYIKGF